MILDIKNFIHWSLMADLASSLLSLLSAISLFEMIVKDLHIYKYVPNYVCFKIV